MSVVEYLEFKKSRYYSARKDGEQITITESFIDEYEDSDYAESLATIMYWMKKLGDRGVTKYELRPEAVNREGKYDYAVAFPVKTEFIKADKKGNNFELFDTNDFEDDLALRLYGLWLDSSVMILLSGCQKTDNNPAKCKNCRFHFYLANNCSSQLNKQTEKFTIKYKKIVSKEQINFEYHEK